ncbi:hypothetical protein QFZ83_004755 [Variovorax sp. W1I1]|uniref:DUF262 domain-containing protein n=1 Tax=Variovorax sp. W1I1 TaxID=3042309 RepID=UPI0027846D37|nr:DUF262 domain-containing protein [Variovorax sp. W1I1]MDQ0610584.1 hypothetical protein [Variovorax sp. W1I1]
MATRIQELEFEDEAEEQDVAEQLDPQIVAAVVTGTDWTTETVVSQLKRKNIQLNPGFQRRDAWGLDRKSRFIESLIVGLPIPQIVLAEVKGERGKFIVLDGKQRLLSILQFWGLGEGENNSYPLSSLTLRDDLKKKTFEDLETDSDLENDYTALCNQPIRTVVIRNWKDTDFLHTIFLRLNTGSVKLSPQELRQALLPGEFSEFIDKAAGSSTGLQKILAIEGPDPRMRDIEIMARFLAFRFFAPTYPGRMKKFLDGAFSEFNKTWKTSENKIASAISEFESGVLDLYRIFGDDIARKPASRQFNRAIFDALIYFSSQPAVVAALKAKGAQVKKSYADLFTPNSGFAKAVESDTAGAPNTAARLQLWAAELSKITGKNIKAPIIPNSSNPIAIKKIATKKIAGKKVAAKKITRR